MDQVSSGVQITYRQLLVGVSKYDKWWHSQHAYYITLYGCTSIITVAISQHAQIHKIQHSPTSFKRLTNVYDVFITRQCPGHVHDCPLSLSPMSVTVQVVRSLFVAVRQAIMNPSGTASQVTVNPSGTVSPAAVLCRHNRLSRYVTEHGRSVTLRDSLTTDGTERDMGGSRNRREQERQAGRDET